MNKHILVIGLLMAVAISINTQQTDFPKITGPYLGQTPPGMTPEIFAPGIVSTKATEFANTFSPDGKEFYFSRFSPEQPRVAIMVTKRQQGRWTEPHIASFSGKYGDCDPVMSPDGKKLFFCSNRPNIKRNDNWDIWVIERTTEGWTEPENPDYPINSDSDEFYPSVTQDGTLYFVSNRDGGLGHYDYYRVKYINGLHGEVENLGATVNTRHREGDGYIAPDEKFFIFSAFIPGNYGSGDLYISLRNKDGTWTKAKNLGKQLNSAGNEFTPMISPDGMFLFFASDRTGNDEIFWASINVIKDFIKETDSGLSWFPAYPADRWTSTHVRHEMVTLH